MNAPADLAPLLESFFSQRLIAQRKVSPHTIDSYRDTFRLLLKFAAKQLGRSPSKLTIEHLAAPFVAAFLAQLETSRANGPRTRNLGLAAIRSFFQYAALEAPQHAGLIQRVLSIPRKRHARPLIDFPHPAGDRGAAVGHEATYLGWTTRSCPLADGSANRPPTLRTDEFAATRRLPGRRGKCPLRRKGTEGALHTVSEIHRRRSWCLDQTARQGSLRLPVPEYTRWPCQCRRRPAPRGKIRA